MIHIPVALTRLANTVVLHEKEISVRLSGNFEFFYEYREGKWERVRGGPITGVCDAGIFSKKAQEADEVMQELRQLAA